MNIMLTGITYWLWLTERLDSAAAWRVYRHFGSPERACLPYKESIPKCGKVIHLRTRLPRMAGRRQKRRPEQFHFTIFGGKGQ